MHNRRDFLKAAAVGVSVLAIGPVSQAAGDQITYTNIVFTAARPGKWAGKQAIHVPQVTIAGTRVAVVTNHPMSNDHFIVRHTLVLADGTYVGAKTFTPDDKPESSHELPAGYKGKIVVTSFCNLHDFWMNEVEV